MKFPDDPILREMIPEFIDWRVSETTENLPSILERNDTDELYRFGHTLKGSGRQFGFTVLASYGVALEGHAKSAQWDHAAAIRHEILQQLQTIKSAFASHGEH